MHGFISETLGYEVIGLQTVPQTDNLGHKITNAITGWPDSFFYDIDLAIAILRDDLIAWCPDAFLPESQEKIRNLKINKIEVSLEEATKGFCCNLISTGETVIMSNNAPKLQETIERHGFKTLTPNITELCKGGGFIRCTSLTLDNS
jgi:N-dimethylarginine dimethylaminohydrolase